VKEIRINCGGCGGSFYFQHPSVNDVSRLLSPTLDCRICGVTLKAPEDELTMIPMDTFLRRSFKAQGIELGDDTVFGVIEIKGDNPDDDEVILESNVIPLFAEPQTRPSPAMMPPHPPQKNMLGQFKVRSPHLTQRIRDPKLKELAQQAHEATKPRPIKDTPQA